MTEYEKLAARINREAVDDEEIRRLARDKNETLMEQIRMRMIIGFFFFFSS